MHCAFTRRHFITSNHPYLFPPELLHCLQTSLQAKNCLIDATYLATKMGRKRLSGVVPICFCGTVLKPRAI